MPHEQLKYKLLLVLLREKMPKKEKITSQTNTSTGQAPQEKLLKKSSFFSTPASASTEEVTIKQPKITPHGFCGCC